MTGTPSISRRVLGAAASLSLALGVSFGALVTVGASTAGAATSIGPVDASLTDGSINSLRDVLENVVNDGDTVVLQAGATYLLDFCATDITAAIITTPGDIEIDASVTIEGNGATIEQTCPDRVLYTQDPLTLENVTITGGQADGEGGGLLQVSDSPTVLDGVTFTGNTAAEGGGMTTFGSATINNSTFTDNEALDGHGGGLRVLSTDATVTVDGSTFDHNHATGWGGGIEQDHFQEEPLAIGEFNLSVTNSNITNNTADSNGGGGIDNEDTAEIRIDHSTVSGNTGGGGGGIGSFAITALHVNASTFSGNTSGGDGGAVQISGLGDTPTAAEGEVSSADFTNSTITENTTASFAAVAVGGTLQLTDVTMANNTTLGQIDTNAAAAGRGGGVSSQADDVPSANVATFSLTTFGSVIAQPHGGPNCVIPTLAITDDGYNFSDDTSCGLDAATSKVATPNDPMLGALANNGGPTMTLLPLAGSPLLDAVPPAACRLTVDQRGVTRPQGTGCDIGAVEVEVIAPSPAVIIQPKFTG